MDCCWLDRFECMLEQPRVRRDGRGAALVGMLAKLDAFGGGAENEEEVERRE